MPALSSPGFILFLGLATYFATHPPTPLAVTAEHLDSLWHELASEVQGCLPHVIGPRTQALGHTLTGRVAALEDRLSHVWSDSVKGVLQDSFCSAPAHALLHNLQSVGQSLSGNLHSLQDQLQHGLHAVEHRLQREAAHLGSGLAERAGVLQGVLAQQLQPIVQWPTPRWPVRRLPEPNTPTTCCVV